MSTATQPKQDNLSRSDSNMPGFIQALYGTVAGASFYVVYNDKSADNLIQITSVWPFEGNKENFKVVLFLFTLVILAHDWFFYHLHDRKKPFIQYLPQIISLFCLSQMFVCAKDACLKSWFSFGFWYTVMGVISAFNKLKEKAFFCWLLFKYAIHFTICLAAFNDVENEAGSKEWGWLFVSMIFVIFIWVDEHRLFKVIKRFRKRSFQQLSVMEKLTSYPSVTTFHKYTRKKQKECCHRNDTIS